MKFSVIHISDIHIRSEDDLVLSQHEKIAAACYRHMPDVEHVFFAVTGDIAFSGKADQYEAAKVFLNKIKDNIFDEYNVNASFLFCPGNHDCDFDKSNEVRKILIENVKKNPRNELGEGVIRECVSVLDEYEKFLTEMSPTPSLDSKLFKSYSFSFEEATIKFNSLNFSWMSELNEKQGEMVYPVEFISDVTSDDQGKSIVISLMHHPFNWFGQGSYHDLKDKICSVSSMILSGHEHTSLSSNVINSNSSKFYHIEAGALQQDSSILDGEFSVLVFDIEREVFSESGYSWDDSKDCFIEKRESGWISYSNFFANQKSSGLSDEFYEKIKDVGGNFVHPTKSSLHRDDVFVFPELKKSDANVDEEEYCNSLELVDSGGNLFLRGGESAGKTFLLYEFFLKHHHLGFAPIYIDCLDVRNASLSKVEKHVNKSVEKQYSKSFLNDYNQTPKSKKIVYLDNFDQLRAASEHRAKFLKYFIDRFERVIVTTGTSLEYGDLTDADIANVSQDFERYEILPFGHQLRHKLIKKWNGASYDLEGNFEDPAHKISEAEASINSVIGKHLVPSTPFYLLTLLQSFEAAQDSGIQNSSYGYYYQYLITNSLKRVNFKPDQLDELFNYCSLLAFEMKKHGDKNISSEDFLAYNSFYSREYTKVDFEERRQKLLKAKILTFSQDFYYFSYSYIYFFFLGKYLAINWEDESIKEIVKECCDHLYVRDNAHAVIFLTHHTNRTDIIKKIINVSSDLFSEVEPISFNGDTEFLNDFIEETSKVIIGEVDPERNQEVERKNKDNMEVDGEVDEYTQPLEELNFQDKINLMFKTVEILGLIAKNYYGSLRNSFKKEIIDESFEAPLRALKHFFMVLEKAQEPLIRELTTIMDEKSSPGDDNEKIAKKLLFDIFGIMSFSFIHKAAASVSSVKLKEVISEVAREKEVVAYKLIDLSTRMEMPGNIPFAYISEIKKITEGNYFSRRLLESIVIRHLYMFKTSDADKQRLSQILNFDIGKQRALTSQNKKR
ncbi:metallophosphoesterase [Vreelandella zhaodongensis]|uniref:Metallophosphoesterase n=1 Tax=Vreelandella zhaodongensis TaxID=1176240 RepID=A0ABX2SSE9_VREZH|nr:metallophosphoesterase [Halomonas zhaodongensis]NYS45047.1 metallophosphoesterase [Halomonas zhaodongensis]